MGVWAGSLSNLLSSIGPNRAIMRRMRIKMRKMRSKMRKMRSKMRKIMRKCEAKCKDTYPKGTLIYASKTGIVATLFRSKIICTVRIRIGSFVLNVPQSLHQSSMTYIDTNLLLCILTVDDIDE